MILAAITTHKRPPEMVERAVKSVIAQTYTDWNLVVVDDSPADWELRDDVRKMVEGYAENDSRVRYVAHDRNYGVSHARNTALDIAVKEGFEYIAYLDDDDEWLPEKLEKQLAKLEECGENTALVYCSHYRYICNVLVPDYNSRVPVDPSNMYATLFTANFSISILTLIRTKCISEVGGFDENLSAIEDYDLWLRMAKKYDIVYVNARLAIIYPEHEGEHVNTNYANVLRAKQIIADKHKDYFASNKYAHWCYLRNTLECCKNCGEYKKFLATFLKMIYLQPLRTPFAIWAVLRIYVISPLKEQFRRRFTGSFYALREIKRRLKGDTTN